LPVEFNQPSSERADEKPAAVGQQRRDGLRLTVQPAIALEQLAVEREQSLRSSSYEKLRVEDAERGQVALRQPVQHSVVAQTISFGRELDEPAVGRREIRILKASDGARRLRVLPELDFIPQQRHARVFFKRDEFLPDAPRPLLRESAPRLLPDPESGHQD
jgi:hypothetical protein